MPGSTTSAKAPRAGKPANRDPAQVSPTTVEGRPILAVEIPDRWLSAEELGLALARVALIGDAIFEETRGWLWIGGRVPDGYEARPVRTSALLDRFSRQLAELSTG